MAEAIRLRFDDLISEGLRGRLPRVVGRETELRRIARTIGRRSRNSVLVVGPPGVGKTALVEGFAATATDPTSTRELGLATPELPIIRLETAQCAQLLSRSATTTARVLRALQALPPAVVVIDELGMLFGSDPEGARVENVLSPFLQRSDLRLLATLTEEEARTHVRGNSRLEKYFEVLSLSAPAPDVCALILMRLAPSLACAYRIRVAPDVVAQAAELALHLPPARALPDRAIQLADEACAHAKLRGKTELTPDDLHEVATERSGMPIRTSASRDQLSNLHATLRTLILGQDHVVSVVSDVLRRSWLGLRNPSRPLGAFMFLGPSGVGKTELARTLSRELYASEHAFVRIDLSEYQEAHTVQRLLGAPPGYVGHEAGGQITNPIAARPFSLILLDEIEKADPAVLDVFLQVLDDGRLTDGKGQTVDFTKSTIIATSNLGADIVRVATETGADVTTADFVRRHLTPVLLRRFRPEFLNRFDAVLPFRLLSVDDLTEIAHLELQKIAARLSRHHVQFRLSHEALRRKATELADPRFGARPLMRYLEALCERAVAERLLTEKTSARVLA